MRSLQRFLGTGALLLAAGCVVVHDDHPRHPHGGPPGQMKKVVVVDAAHVCVDACDHVFIDGVWYVEVGHRHGPGCGHVLLRGKWILHDKDDDKPGRGRGRKDKD